MMTDETDSADWENIISSEHTQDAQMTLQTLRPPPAVIRKRFLRSVQGDWPFICWTVEESKTISG